jgi:hypothetical protein
MQTAIAACGAIDECMALSNQATAVAAYYKQIKDDTSMRQFLEIKMRAWRRIGEIIGAIDTSDCETFAARTRKFRQQMPLDEMSDAHIKQAIDIAALPLAFFEDAAAEGISNITRLLSTYEKLQREQQSGPQERGCRRHARPARPDGHAQHGLPAQGVGSRGVEAGSVR